MPRTSTNTDCNKEWINYYWKDLLLATDKFSAVVCTHQPVCCALQLQPDLLGTELIKACRYAVSTIKSVNQETISTCSYRLKFCGIASNVFVNPKNKV